MQTSRVVWGRAGVRAAAETRTYTSKAPVQLPVVLETGVRLHPATLECVCVTSSHAVVANKKWQEPPWGGTAGQGAGGVSSWPR